MKSGPGLSNSTGNNSASADTSDQSFLPLAMRNYPSFLSLHERYAPVSQDQSFAKSFPGYAKTESDVAFSRQDINRLIAQWMSERGYVQAVSVLQAEAGLVDHDLFHPLGSSLLHRAVQCSAPEPSSLFAVGDGASLVEGEDDAEVEVVGGTQEGGGASAVWGGGEDEAAVWSNMMTGGSNNSNNEPVTVGQLCWRLVRGAGANKEELRGAVADTYTVWTSAGEMLRTLFQMYEVPQHMQEKVVALHKSGNNSNINEDNDEDKVIKKHGHKVTRVIVWFVTAARGPPELVAGLVGRFASKLSNMGKTKDAAELRQAVARAQSAVLHGDNQHRKWEEPQVPRNIFSPQLVLADVPQIEVARQMTLLDYETFRSITPAELLSLGWTTSDARLRNRAPHILTAIHRFKVVEKWVSVSCLRARNNAPKVFAYFVQLAKCLLEMHSANSALAVISGILCENVWKTEKIFDALSDELKASFKFMELLASPKNCFSTYREWFSKQPSPALPFLHAHLQMIVLASHCTPTFVDNNAVNLEKIFALHRCVRNALNAVQNKFPFLVVAQVQAFLTTKRLEMDIQ